MTELKAKELYSIRRVELSYEVTISLAYMDLRVRAVQISSEQNRDSNKKEDRPAGAPLCPAWLPEEPAKANTAAQKQGKSTIQLSTKLKRGGNHLPKAAKEQKNYWYNRKKIRTLQLLRAPQIRRLKSPNWHQSKELSKTNPTPPISLQTTAEIDGNLTEKGPDEQY
ncbi:resolvase [Dorcoceras hygrometricum]|uniref:Resolvase n=1 Tax=Dorcoceras hygrometricum TaxID=472368 RepID=A0A2Z7AH07_9LAMI|nr:resolvase [Dorcoceras hygrometricum]